MNRNNLINNQNDCGYLDLQNQSSINMLKPCINKIVKHNIQMDTRGVIEGFTENIECPIIKEGEKICPDSYSNINGECVQVCRGCNYNDLSGYFGTCQTDGRKINVKTKDTRIQELNDEIVDYIFDISDS